MEPQCVLELVKSEDIKLEHSLADDVFVEDEVIFIKVESQEQCDFKQEIPGIKRKGRQKATEMATEDDVGPRDKKPSGARKKSNLNSTRRNPQPMKKQSKKYHRMEKKQTKAQSIKVGAPDGKKAANTVAKKPASKRLAAGGKRAAAKPASVEQDEKDAAEVVKLKPVKKRKRGRIPVHPQPKSVLIDGCKTYFCKDCKFSTKTSSHMRYHTARHNGDLAYNCRVCSFSCFWPSALKKHEATHSSDKPYKCDLCSFTCCQSGHLKLHLAKHTGVKPYKCDVCSYSCILPVHLKQHKHTHAGERPYKCTVCPYRSRQPGVLKKHVDRQHSALKKYNCNECSFSSSRSRDFQVHMAIHTGHKTFKCTKCKYSTFESAHLKVHMTTHDEKKSYKCTECKFSTSTSSNLKRHVASHTGNERTVQCDMCSYSCVLDATLKKHMRTHWT